MPSSLASDILLQLSNYLEDRISLRTFRDWFAPVSWHIEDCKDSQAIELAYRIDRILAESASAAWLESDLREELAAIRPPVGLGPRHTVPH